MIGKHQARSAPTDLPFSTGGDGTVHIMGPPNIAIRISSRTGKLRPPQQQHSSWIFNHILQDETACFDPATEMSPEQFHSELW